MILTTFAFGLELNPIETLGIYLFYYGWIVGLLLLVAATVYYMSHKKTSSPKKKLTRPLLIGLTLLALAFLGGPLAWNTYYDWLDKQDTAAARQHDRQALDGIDFELFKLSYMPPSLAGLTMRHDIDFDFNEAQPSVIFEFRRGDPSSDSYPGDQVFSLVEYRPIISEKNKECSVRLFYNFDDVVVQCRVIGQTKALENVIEATSTYDEVLYYIDKQGTRVVIQASQYQTEAKIATFASRQEVIDMFDGLVSVKGSEINLD